MKKYFEIIGLLALFAFSFYCTEKTANVIKEIDNLMILIKEDMNNHKVEPIDALIDGNTIIPGINGYEVDINGSYQKMKKIGKYNSILLEYNGIKPNISIANNYNKYIIGGNKNKKEVSLLFKVKDSDNVLNIIDILKENNIRGNFFIDGNWLEKNNELIYKIIDNNVIGNMGYNGQYDKNSIWVNSIISHIVKQKINFCYNEVENENENNLFNCSLNKNYTIRPSIIVNENPIIEIKKNLESGSIISLPINSIVEKELPLIIKYIKSKDLKIVDLIELIKE